MELGVRNESCSQWFPGGFRNHFLGWELGEEQLFRRCWAQSGMCMSLPPCKMGPVMGLTSLSSSESQKSCSKALRTGRSLQEMPCGSRYSESAWSDGQWGFQMCSCSWLMGKAGRRAGLTGNLRPHRPFRVLPGGASAPSSVTVFEGPAFKGPQEPFRSSKSGASGGWSGERSFPSRSLRSSSVEWVS